MIVAVGPVPVAGGGGIRIRLVVDDGELRAVVVH